MDGHYRDAEAGHAATGKIADKLLQLGPGTDSVAVYGKTISNARRVLRVGLHGSAYCEALPGDDASARRTRPSVDFDFRAPSAHLRVMHLMDSYKKRSRLDKGNSSIFSYYVRDWSGLVNDQ